MRELGQGDRRGRGGEREKNNCIIVQLTLVK